jgi:cellulose synthase (UDP-forming)
MFLESGIILLNVIFIFNSRKRKYVLSGGPHSMRPIVDIFITIKNEDAKLFEKTVKSAVGIFYPNKRIYVLDDGGREDVKKIADKYACTYLSRDDKEAKSYKAANLNYGLKHAFGNFILTLDADMQANPNILDELLGFFNDNDKLGFVSTRQGFDVDVNDFNHENLFYEYMQAGKNSYGVGISCGSGVIYRRSALDKIGGFQEWNIVEDLYTSYVLNSNGYSSIYVSQSFTHGDAPTDLAAIYKQRGLWAQDTLRLLIYKNPLFRKGLTFSKRLQYFEIGYSYIVSGLFFPMIYLMNIYSLVANDPIIILGKEWYLLLRIPSFFISLQMFSNFSKGTSSMKMWAGLFPVYFKAFIKALLYKKPVYKVTPKGLKPRRSILLVLPQLTFLIAAVGAVIFHIFTYGLTWVFAINTYWVCVMIYFMSGVVIKAFPKKKYEKNINN